MLPERDTPEWFEWRRRVTGAAIRLLDEQRAEGRTYHPEVFDDILAEYAGVDLPIGDADAGFKWALWAAWARQVATEEQRRTDRVAVGAGGQYHLLVSVEDLDREPQRRQRGHHRQDQRRPNPSTTSREQLSLIDALDVPAAGSTLLEVLPLDDTTSPSGKPTSTAAAPTATAPTATPDEGATLLDLLFLDTSPAQLPQWLL